MSKQDGNHTETKKTVKQVSKQQPLPKLTPLNSGQATDFMCDLSTGICGPITKKKEGS